MADYHLIPVVDDDDAYVTAFNRWTDAGATEEALQHLQEQEEYLLNGTWQLCELIRHDDDLHDMEDEDGPFHYVLVNEFETDYDVGYVTLDIRYYW